MEHHQPNMKIVIFLAMFVVSCVAQEEAMITSSSNEFGFGLLKEIPVSPQTNIIYSPYSVYTALAMAYIGARGETQQEIGGVLGYLSLGLSPNDVLRLHAEHTRRLREPSNSTLHVTHNAVFQRGTNLQRHYKDTVYGTFRAEVGITDLTDDQSVKNINDWFKRKTEGKIERLLSEPPTSDARFLLLNGIYFKGLWNTPFRPRATFKAPFFNAGTEPVEVYTMHQQLTTGYAEDDETDTKVVELSYAGLDYSMVVVLPRYRSGVDSLRRNFSLPLYHSLLSKLRETLVDVALPMFKIESWYKLKGPLSNMGVSKIFEKNQADFTGLSGSRDLFINDVMHKAVLEVNEKGSEAAGATTVALQTDSFVIGTPFAVDRPFLFIIRNRHTEDILFVGQVDHL